MRNPSIKLLFIFLFFNFSFTQQVIFRTTIIPARIFIDSKGGNSSLTVTNSSSDTLEIRVGTENSQEENIRFFPRTFNLPPKGSQIVRLQVKEEFFQLKEEEKILYITEFSPLVIINDKKFRPRHGITIREKE